MLDVAETHEPQKKKRRFRFGIRTLIVCLTIVCLVLAFACALIQPAINYSQKKERALALIESVGGKIELKGLNTEGPPGKNWLTRRTGHSPWVEKLWKVDLSNSKITAKQSQALSGYDWIRQLDLSGTQLTDDDLGFLSGLAKMRELKLNGIAITDKGLKHVKNLDRLILFEVANTDVTWKGLDELDRSFEKRKAFADAYLASKFPFEGVEIRRRYEGLVPHESDEWGMHLSSYSYAQRIHLNSGKQVSPATFKDLRKLTRVRDFYGCYGDARFYNPEIIAGWTELRSIMILGGQLTDDDFRHIASLKNLRYLYLSGSNQISDRAILMFGENHSLEKLEIKGKQTSLEITRHLGGLKALRRLDLSVWVSRKRDLLSAEQAIESVEALQRLEQLPKLDTLVLYGNCFSDEAILSLAKLSNLKRIAVLGDYYKPDTLKLLKERRPDCQIETIGFPYKINLD